MNILKNLLLTLILSTVILTSVATAQDSGSYVSAYGGINLKPDSANSGELTSNFTTGAGTTIPAGTVLLSGTSLSWDTDFDTGYGLGFAYGYRVGNGLRPELEVRYSSNSVSGHANVAVGGAPIGTEDRFTMEYLVVSRETRLVSMVKVTWTPGVSWEMSTTTLCRMKCSVLMWVSVSGMRTPI